jgi:hypothetical protein
MYKTNAVGIPVRLSDIQNPKPMVPLRAACCCAVQVVQLGLMRRRKHPLFELAPLPPHQSLIRYTFYFIHMLGGSIKSWYQENHESKS